MSAETDNDSIQTYEGVEMRGINISGAEAGSDVSYAYQGMPSLSQDMAYYIDHGMNTIRFPIKWSYITETISSDSPSAEGQVYLDTVAASIHEMLDAGLNVILDFHSYMRFSPGTYAGGGSEIATTQDMYNIWSILAENLKEIANEHPDSLVLEIANEPNSMSTTQVLENNNAGIAAIRDAGLTNLISIQGNSWSGLHSWLYPNQDGLSNAEVFVPENIIDPLNNYAIAVHQYVDWNGSGTSPQGQELGSFIEYANFDEFMNWVHEHNVKVLFDEFGSGNDANGFADVNYLLSQVEANPYVEGEGGFIGWAAWVGGHTWAQNNFNYIGPNPDGTDNDHMLQVYLQHLDPTDGSIVIPPPTDPVDPAPTEPPENTTDPEENTDPTPPPNETSSGGYVVAWDWGAREVISDFDVNTDSINLSEFWTQFDNFSISEDGKGNLDINLLDIDNHTITLQNVTLAEFSASNIKGVPGNYLNAVVDHPVQYYSYSWDYGVNHTIDDFNPDTGVFELVGFSRGFGDYEIYNNSDGDAVVNVPFNSQSITLTGVSADQLNADNFFGVSGSYTDALTNPPVIENPDPTPPPEETAPAEEPTPPPEETAPAEEPTPPPEETAPPEEPTPPPEETAPAEEPTPPPEETAPPEEPTPPPSDPGAGSGQTINVGWNWGAHEVVTNFNAGTDTVDLTTLWSSYNQIKLYEDGDGNLVIDLLDLNNHTVTLNNTTLAEFSADNIVGVSGNYADAVQADPMKLYSYSWDYGNDSIVGDFDPNVGVIDISAFQRGYNDVTLSDDADGNAVVDLAFDSQTITLTGVSRSEITADNFLGV